MNSGSIVFNKLAQVRITTITRSYDGFDRPAGYTLDVDNSTRQVAYAYDNGSGRLVSVSSGGRTFAYTYIPGTDRVSGYACGGFARTVAYEGRRDLIVAVTNAFNGGCVSAFAYVNDAAGRRTSIARSGTAFGNGSGAVDAYGYNARSEVISSRRTLGGNPVWAFANDYAYDPIGNRTSSSDLGTTRAYTANSLNQYTGISDGVDTFVPQFDDDGDQTLIQTKTGIWSVTYNGENRPVSWSCGETNITMSFDRMGRRVSYTETVGVTTNAHRTFVYDNYLQIADNAGSRYLWDPSEPIATRPLVWRYGGNTYSYTHDGNKNVSEVVDVNGTIVAHYEYAPFGDVTVSVGSLTSANRFRFSSEYADDTLGLVYYNYRHYEPVTGRWMGRDQFTLITLRNLFRFIDNSPVLAIDVLGFYKIIWKEVQDLNIKPFNGGDNYGMWTGVPEIKCEERKPQIKQEEVARHICPNGCRYLISFPCKYVFKYVESTIHLPKWTKLNNYDKHTKAIWEHYLKLLLEHEKKHANAAESFIREGDFSVQGQGCDIDSANRALKQKLNSELEVLSSKYEDEQNLLQDQVDKEDVLSLLTPNGKPIKIIHNGEDYFE